jgi:DNA-binding MarR family transcriptional regulator
MNNHTISPDDSDSSHLPDHELEVLQHIAHANDVRQRDLAQIIGMSLGMTNAILNRLARKGLITIRKVNNRNIMYAVSPDGFEEIARRSYRYLKRTIKNVVVYRETIESLVELIADQGFDEIDLIEQSDLDFIVQHACGAASVKYGRNRVTTAFVLHSEQLEPPAGRRSLEDLESAIVGGAREAYLSEVLI